MSIEVKGTLLRTQSESDGTYTMFIKRPGGGLRCIQMLTQEFVVSIYKHVGPSNQVEFSFTDKE